MLPSWSASSNGEENRLAADDIRRHAVHPQPIEQHAADHQHGEQECREAAVSHCDS